MWMSFISIRPISNLTIKFTTLQLCILFQVAILEDLGVETALLMFHGNQVSHYGSQQGFKFLETNSKINYDFSEFLSKLKPIKNQLTHH